MFSLIFGFEIKTNYYYCYKIVIRYVHAKQPQINKYIHYLRYLITKP